MGKAKTKTYPPLDLLRKAGDIEELGYGAIVKLAGSPRFSSLAPVGTLETLSRHTEDEYIAFLQDKDEFLNTGCASDWKKVNVFLIRLSGYLLSGAVRKRIASGKASLQAEMADVLLAPCLWKRWGRNKQSYKPDPEFSRALIGTEELQVTKNMLEHLPVSCFYVDLSGCREFLPGIGALVGVETYPDGAALTVYLLTEDLSYFSYYTGGTYDGNGCLTIDLADLPEIEGDNTYDYTVILPDGREKKYGDITVTRRRASFFVLQLLCYLTSKEPEIEESPETKYTYRAPSPGSVPKTRYSELQVWDVGVRYGNSVRVWKEEHTPGPVTFVGSENGDPACPDKGMHPRKPPVPHFRSAHWQRYWTGKGRTVCETKWIAPVFVKGTGMENPDVVIHRVQKEA